MSTLAGTTGPRTTSHLNDARNDTGRTAFCGPYVISAITGYSITRIEQVIRELRCEPEESKSVIKGTYPEEVEAALQKFGFAMTQIANYMTLPRKERPSVWAWMQKPRNAWSHYILAISKGKEGHWILIKGVKMCDTFTDGKWTFVCDGPHRGAKIMEIFEVKKDLGV